MTRTSKNTSTSASGTTSQKQKVATKGSLAEKLQQTSPEQLAIGVSRSDKLTKTDEDKNHRYERMQDAKTIGVIRRAFYWACFVLLIIFLIHFAITFYEWVEVATNSDKGLESYVFRIWDYLLVILATLFIEGSIRGRKD